MAQALMTAAYAAAAAPAPPGVPRLGINLNGPADWNTEIPFVDVFHFSRAWISQHTGQPWGKGPSLDRDAHGWIRHLEPDCWVETPMCTIDGGHYPAGDYTVFYEGEGRIEATGAGTITERAPGRLTMHVEPARGGFFLQIRKTDPANYIRNIRVILPGFAKSYRTEPFPPAFLKRWKGVACLRFMDWMQTNNSPIRHWSDRPQIEDANWTERGVPVSVMCDLTNRLAADAWFCIPHAADDDYVRRFAMEVKARLAPGRRVYIEYSNEVWNGQFEQDRYAGAEGRRLGFGDKEWEAAWHYTAYRSRQVFRIFETVFGGHSRLVRVLPSQVANAYVSEQIVGFQDAYKEADALAVAPYLGFTPGPETKPAAADVDGWTPAQVIAHLRTNTLPELQRWLGEQKRVADKYHLALIAYEGGQHLVGIQGAENDEKLTALLQTVNRDPALGDLYRDYYRTWTDSGGGLFCYFSSVGSWSKWGSWGILEYYDSDPGASPKFMATMDWARSLGQPVKGTKQ